MVEITTGKKTLHDTVGITYQAITKEEPLDQGPCDDKNLSSEEEICFTREVTKVIQDTYHKRKRSRTSPSVSLGIRPFRKNFLFNDDPKRLKFEKLLYV